MNTSNHLDDAKELIILTNSLLSSSQRPIHIDGLSLRLAIKINQGGRVAMGYPADSSTFDCTDQRYKAGLQLIHDALRDEAIEMEKTLQEKYHATTGIAAIGGIVEDESRDG